MPESNAAAKRRQFKQNRAAGIGDETGRLVRVKDSPTMLNCNICQAELKVTKTNTELNAHATSKHGKSLDECFPRATQLAADMMAATQKGKGGTGGDGSGKGADGLSKAERKKKVGAGMDDLLDAGLSAGKKGSSKKR